MTLTFWITVVEESAWRVSALGGLSSDATATLYDAIIAGTFTLLGVMIERLTRVLGRLRLEVSERSLIIEESPRERGIRGTFR